ncbi:hypothetical protein GR238_36425 [Rhizobium leguminosarum]|nr:hypothetical protein [Rhizobium ruizarguesonis]NEJ10813.1 hypothetical protein [Rhizobium ruizarguesonis]
MAEILHFPRQPATPRLVLPDTMNVHDHMQFQAAVRHLTAAGQIVLSAAFAAEGREALFAASAAAAEAALFHLLTLKGACNADLPLRRLLVERDRERSKP